MINYSLETIFFAVLLSLGIILFGYVLFPFLSVLILAVTLSIIFRPLWRLLVRIFKGHETAASLTTVLIVLLLIIIPLIFLGFRALSEASNLLANLTSGRGINYLSALVSDFLAGIGKIFNLNNPISVNFNDYLRQLLLWLVQNFGRVFSSISGILVTIFLSLLGFFYFLKDGLKFKKQLVAFLPLSPEYSEEIISRLVLTVNSVIRGILVVAIIQGVLAGIEFAVFGVPNAVIWGCLAAIAALIPIIGISLVLIPVVIFLLLTGHTLSALILLVLGYTIAGLIDNLLSPYIIKRKIMIHPFLILLSVLGGINVFGPIGFLIGPLALSFLFALLNIYPLMLKK